jgi:hypothetical protein
MGTRQPQGGTRWPGLILQVGVILILLSAATANAQVKIESADGSQSMKFGFLVQGRFEMTDLADGSDQSQDLYFRRLRLLFGGNITKKLSYFFETDSPNLGKGNADGSKTTSDIYIQDFVLTYKFSEAFHLDGGLVLIPTCYNCNQSAAALLPVDYGAFSFLSSGPTTANVGRDYGLQARGYLGNDHFEYRAGVFQGYRDEDSTGPFRYAFRFAWYPFEAPKGLFYPGTTLGAKKIISLGASYDTQDDYRTYAFDFFWDQPMFDGDGLTIQYDYVNWDGGDYLASFPAQTSTLFEIGYYFHAVKLTPYFEWLSRDYDPTELGDEDRYQLGLAYWPRGHNLNFKLGFTRLEKDGAKDRDQVILQCQVFMF